MPKRPIILLTNDDGIDAPGLAALEKSLAALGEVWVVAPSSERSTSSHSLTLMRPVQVTPSGRRRFAIGGTPADSVFVALFGLLPRRPSLVVSGINRGPNLGTDVIYSGTVAAAREAAMHRIPAMAVSLNSGNGFTAAARVAAKIARAALDCGVPMGTKGAVLLANVNVPAGGGCRFVFTRLGWRRYPDKVEIRKLGFGDRYAWFGLGAIGSDSSIGSDTATVARGDVSITLLRVDQADPEGRERFGRLVGRLERSGRRNR